MAADLAQELRDIDLTKASPKKVLYFSLCATSLIVMASAVRVFRTALCSGVGGTIVASSCRRTSWAISLGVLSFVAAIGLVLFNETKGIPVELEASALSVLFIMWIFGIAYITFGVGAPATTIGNLYFATWISFILSMLLMGAAVGEYIAKREGGKQKEGDIEEDRPVNARSSSIIIGSVSDPAVEEKPTEATNEGDE